ncbi:MAG: sulfite exporter TauE/SafE family protein [Pseudomonadota bacterium]|nr:sulfite exporter TauE/SafE family protein [Pseudomonadota bacterium]MDE3037271.1 sulfite exporter TauE/SafE family protein [Pseudomonadota bacterium]
MTLPDIAIFFGISFLAAAINSVAGGGTFLTFPVFILSGLTALQANIMSTIALWPGTVASAWGYRRVLQTDRKTLHPLLAIGLVGGAAGAGLLLATSEITFKALVPWLMLLATLVFTFGRRLISVLNRCHLNLERGLPAFATMALIAVYGGYFGAGIGILTLAMLQMMGHAHIHRMNAMKTILTGAVNAITVLIFIFSGKVIWPMAAVMIAGAVAGGYMGARCALKISPEKVRLLVSVIGFSMTMYFFLKYP